MRVVDARLISALVLANLCALIGACLLGSTPLPPDRLLLAMLRIGQETDQIVVWDIRLPRALAAFLVGSALAASGGALQGLLRNPLAEPGVLGVSATAALGATFAIYYGLASFTSIAVPIAAIIGALGATSLLAIAAFRTTSVVTLILVGVGISSFAGALMALMLNLAPNPFTLSDMVNWTLGSVINRSFDDILLASPFLFAGLVALILALRGLKALTLGEEIAATIGADLKRTRLLVIFGTGCITGAAVSIAGAVGFVGIVAPHVIRPWVGHDPARLVIPSALLGGLFIVVADIVIRLVPTTTELKLGVVAALVGAPAFVWIAISRGRHNG